MPVSSQLAAAIGEFPTAKRSVLADPIAEDADRIEILAPLKAGVRFVYRLIRRTLRLTVGLAGVALLLLVFLRWVVIPTGWPTTSEAWLQAPLVVVRADADGNVELGCQDGDLVEPGAHVATIANANVDPARVSHLKSALASVDAEHAKFCKDLESAQSFDRLSSCELAAYRRTLVAGLKLSLVEAESQIAECVVAHDQAKRVADLNRRAAATGAASEDERLRAIEAESIARTRLERARAVRDRFQVEIEAAEKNVFVQRESPIYLSFQMQGRLSIPQIEANVAHVKERRAAIQAELGQIEEYAKRQAGSIVRTPVGGVVWRRTPGRGSVSKGESLVEVAETRRMFIEAVFPEGHSQSLTPGVRAVVVFRGLPPFEGRVQAVRQPSPTDQDTAYAIQHPRRLNQLKAVITFEGARPDATLLGRQCSVMIPDSTTYGHDWAERLFIALRW